MEFDRTELATLNKLKQAEWEPKGRTPVSGNLYKAHFAGADMEEVAAFLERRAQMKDGNYAATTDTGNHDGFVILAEGEMRRMGIDPEKKIAQR